MIETDLQPPNCRRQLARFCADENGATAIEYAMIASGIGGVVAVTVFALGGGVTSLFTTLLGLFP